jgi:hypothetical protein
MVYPVFWLLVVHTELQIVTEQLLTYVYIYVNVMASAYSRPAERTTRKRHVGYKVAHRCMPARYAVV